MSASKKPDLGSVVASAAAELAPQVTKPEKPKGPSPGLMQKASETAIAVDRAREYGEQATALRKELLIAMTSEGIDVIPMPDRKPITRERGDAWSAPSQTILKANLSAEDAAKVWDATKKPYDKVEIPKPDGPSEPVS